MRQFPEVKYVGLKSKSSLNYVETACVRNPELRSEMVSHEVEYGLPLYPLLFWYDKTHICSIDHYRNFVFRDQPTTETRNAQEAKTSSAQNRLDKIDAVPQWHAGLFKPGDFIEDTFGHFMLSNIRSNGFQAHEKYGAYVYDDGGGAIISHLDGRRFLTPSQRERQGMPRHIVRSGPAYVREALQAYHE